MSLRLAALLVFVTLLVGCGTETPPVVNSYLTGQLSFRPEVDSTADYRGFEVLVLSNREGDVDTLALVVTDSTGRFQTNLSAPGLGVYPIMVSRAGQTLTIEELVIGDHDTTSVRGAFPLNGRRLRIVSRENAAWAAYKNTKAQFNQSMLDLAQSGSYSEDRMAQVVGQTSTIFWSLRSTYTGTLGATVAGAESVVMLDGWNDSLVVDRLRQLDDFQPGLMDALRAGRRAVARLAGQDSAMTFVRSYLDRVPDGERPAVHSELVLARMDSVQRPEALAEARTLLKKYPDGDWAVWAQRAIYEMENLMPGMDAPAFSLLDRGGEVISNASLRDRLVILEFYKPMEERFLRDLRDRRQLIRDMDPDLFTLISISLEADSVVNEALFDEFTIPGRFVFAENGVESTIARMFNVNYVPTRFLIGPDGKIVSKYLGSGFEPLRRDMNTVLIANGR